MHTPTVVLALVEMHTTLVVVCVKLLWPDMFLFMLGLSGGLAEPGARPKKSNSHPLSAMMSETWLHCISTFS